MAFAITNPTQPGKGGGFYGDGRTCSWKNWRVEEHGLTKHGPDGVTVLESYPPQCMLGVDLYAERTELDDDKFPQFQTQWYSIGQLPLSRLEALGWPLNRLQASVLTGPGGQAQWKRRLQNPGGFQPSADAKSPSTVGAFFGSDPPEKVYDGSPYWQLMAEVIGLGNAGGEVVEDRLIAHGVAALEGLVAVAGKKEMPKSKSQLQKEDQARKLGVQVEQKDARQIMVPAEIVKWPWGAGEAVPVGQPAAAGPVAVAAPTAAAPVAAVPAASSSNGSADLDKRIARVLVGLLGKPQNSLGLKVAPATVAVPMMQAFAKDPQMNAATHRSVRAEFLGGDFNGLLWQYDAAAGTLRLPGNTSAEDVLGMVEAL